MDLIFHAIGRYYGRCFIFSPISGFAYTPWHVGAAILGLIVMKIKRYIYIGVAFLLTANTLFASSGASDAHAGDDIVHKMMMLAMQLGVILIAARLANLLFEKIKMPGVLGELAVGMIIGPYLLGGIALPGFADGIFPLASSTFPISAELYGICVLASIILLFQTGLETNLKMFLSYSVVGSLVGIGGVVGSFLLGDLLGVWFSPMLFGKQVGMMHPGCFFLGVMSTATSVGITARILSEKRKLDSPEGVTILAGAVIDDVLGIILLAVGVGIAAATHETGGHIEWAKIGRIGAEAFGIWLGATIFGLLTARKISNMLKYLKDRSSISVLALGLGLILAGLFEKAGLAMIVGAYVMGLSLSKTDIAHLVREKLEPVQTFLVPVFFTVMGMLVNFEALASKEVLGFGLLFSAVAIVAKIIGCSGPALMCNFNIRGALRVGFGMVPRGEVALIIAGIGLSAGILTDKIFGISILMTLITTVIAPPMLVLLFKNPASGLKNPPPDSEDEQIEFSLPSTQIASFLLSKLTEAFEAENFFVHAISYRDKIYQLRKDDIIIGFAQKGSQIIFDCSKAHVPFVSTAMMEVLAEFESTLKELRKPVDAKKIGEGMMSSSPNKSNVSFVANYFNQELMIPELKGETKKDIIDELMQAIQEKNSSINLDKARQAVLDREESMSTGIGHGLAIPHGRSSAVKELTCVVGLKKSGIDFDSIDGEPSQIFILTLSPDGVATPYMQFMSGISQLLDEHGRKYLKMCETAEEMYNSLVFNKKPAASIVSTEPRQTEHMLENYIKAELIKVELASDTKEDAINELLELMAKSVKIRDINKVKEQILEREEQMPTGLNANLAIPHARTDLVDNLVCVIGIKKHGIDFGADNDQKSRIIVLTLCPVESAAPYLQFLSVIMTAFASDKVQAILDCKSSEEVVGKICDK